MEAEVVNVAAEISKHYPLAGSAVLILILISTYMSKFFVQKNKDLIDADRQVTKLQRDAKSAEQDARIKTLEIKTENAIKELNVAFKHSVDETKILIESIVSQNKRIFNKMDNIEANLKLIEIAMASSVAKGNKDDD